MDETVEFLNGIKSVDLSQTTESVQTSQLISDLLSNLSYFTQFEIDTIIDLISMRYPRLADKIQSKYEPYQNQDVSSITMNELSELSRNDLLINMRKLFVCSQIMRLRVSLLLSNEAIRNSLEQSFLKMLKRLQEEKNRNRSLTDENKTLTANLEKAQSAAASAALVNKSNSFSKKKTKLTADSNKKHAMSSSSSSSYNISGPTNTRGRKQTTAASKKRGSENVPNKKVSHLKTRVKKHRQPSMDDSSIPMRVSRAKRKITKNTNAKSRQGSVSVTRGRQKQNLLPNAGPSLQRSGTTIRDSRHRKNSPSLSRQKSAAVSVSAGNTRRTTGGTLKNIRNNKEILLTAEIDENSNDFFNTKSKTERVVRRKRITIEDSNTDSNSGSGGGSGDTSSLAVDRTVPPLIETKMTSIDEQRCADIIEALGGNGSGESVVTPEPNECNVSQLFPIAERRRSKSVGSPMFRPEDISSTDDDDTIDSLPFVSAMPPPHLDGVKCEPAKDNKLRTLDVSQKATQPKSTLETVLKKAEMADVMSKDLIGIQISNDAMIENIHSTVEQLRELCTNTDEKE